MIFVAVFHIKYDSSALRRSTQINVKRYEKYYVPNLLDRLVKGLSKPKCSWGRAFVNARTRFLDGWCDERLLFWCLSWNFKAFHLSSVFVATDELDLMLISILFLANFVTAIHLARFWRNKCHKISCLDEKEITKFYEIRCRMYASITEWITVTCELCTHTYRYALCSWNSRNKKNIHGIRFSSILSTL